ncbi:MAG: CRISPR-associated protein Cas4 [Candidatus Humimicrobiaceae bacterium]
MHSFELGLSGKADMVEFHKIKDCGKCKPFPVEYKRGKPKADDSDKIQLCAQALCLEEMMKVKIDDGALFLWMMILVKKFWWLIKKENRKR